MNMQFIILNCLLDKIQQYNNNSMKDKTLLNSICGSFFNIPFKIISAHVRRANRWGENGRTPRKTTWHTCKQNLACLTSALYGAQTHTRHSGENVVVYPTTKVIEVGPWFKIWNRVWFAKSCLVRLQGK